MAPVLLSLRVIIDFTKNAFFVFIDQNGVASVCSVLNAGKEFI